MQYFKDGNPIDYIQWLDFEIRGWQIKGCWIIIEWVDEGSTWEEKILVLGYLR